MTKVSSPGTNSLRIDSLSAGPPLKPAQMAANRVSLAISAGGAAVTSSTGGDGAGGGDGKAVSVINSGVLLLKGDRDIGILAQSVGGGGGSGGFSIGLAAATADSSDQGVGGKGGAGGNGGAVEVHNNAGGTINTLGAMAYGIEAQSVGGGGGNGGFAIGAGLSIDKDVKTTIGGGAGGAA